MTSPLIYIARRLSLISKYSPIVLLSGLLLAQVTDAQVAEGAAFYKSQIDELINIEKVAVLPFVDNLDGIYSRPLESHIIELLKDDHHWDLISTTTTGPLLSPNEIAQDLNRAKTISTSVAPADAFLAARITKGPNGINIDLSLFLTKDSLLFAQQQLKNSSRFDLPELQNQMTELLSKIKKQIPYSGRVLSRDGNRVTVNLGHKDGVVEKQVVPIVQILKLNRHPKFNFLVNTEKEILGRVKLLKIEDRLSFGMILSEREKEAIQPEAKVAGIEFIEYDNADSLSGAGTSEDLSARPDKDIAFGKSPQEWVPQNPPTFGRAAASFGLGLYKTSSNTRSGETYEATNPMYPSVAIDGELWMTHTWALHFALQQGIVPINNSSGSSPTELSQSLSKYDFLVGYYIRMAGGGIWDPWVELIGGFSNYRLFVDDSNPRTFTTVDYGGFKFGLRGQFPISNSPLWSAGAKAYFFWKPTLKESPVTSGASNTSTINEFGVFAGYRIKSHIQLVGGLDFSLYSSSFSGNGSRTNDASSLSQRHTVLNGGVNFYF